MNRQGVVLGCNDAQARDLGFAAPRGLIGKKVEELLPPELPRSVFLSNAKMMELGDSRVVEELCFVEGGVVQSCLSHKVPLRDPTGEVVGLLGVSLNDSHVRSASEG